MSALRRIEPFGERLRARAAVLVEFELSWLALTPASDQEWTETADFLDRDTRAVPTRRGAPPRYVVREDVRTAAARAGISGLRSALAAVAKRPRHPLQTTIDRVIGRGEVIDLDRLSRPDLERLAQVSRWFEAAGAPIPAYAQLEHRLRRELMLDPLRAIATDHFRDREQQRRQLRDQRPGRPSSVLAPGGVGKSALLARHLLDCVERGDLIGYLNFDHNALDPRSSAGLLVELATQLSWQVGPDRTGHLPGLIAQAGSLRRSRSSASATGSRTLSAESDRWRSMLGEMGVIVGSRRLTVVLDTIEEARRRDYDLASLRRFVIACAELGWSVIVSGRALVPDLPTVPIELTGLPPADALSMLTDLLAAPPATTAVRLTEAELRDRLTLIGTGPLAIQLGARLLRAAHGDVGVFADLDLTAGVVEGELYRRWLGYVDDPDVRLIAYPGLTLRRITPDLIQHVLADALGLRVPDVDRAEVLFEGIAREAMLVDRVDPQTVEHRSDLRPLMLARLARDNQPMVQAIHASAVAYFAARSDPASRVEELYHRLMRQDDASTLDARWDEHSYPELVAAIDELPASGRAYLVGRHPELQSRFGPDELADLDDARRRPVLAGQITSLIEAGATEKAVALLAEARTTHGEPLLPLLELQVLELTGQLHEALQLGRAEQAQRARSGDLAGVLEASLHVARLLERLGDGAAAGRELHNLADRVGRHGARATTDVQRLRLVTTQLRLLRFGSTADERTPLVRRALARYDALPPGALHGQPALLRDLAGELGAQAPARLLSAALEAGDLTDADGSVSAALTSFDQAVSRIRGRTQGVLADQTKSYLIGIGSTGSDAASEVALDPVAGWQGWLEGTDASLVASEVGSLIDHYSGEVPAEVGESITRNFRIAADQANAYTIEGA